MERRELLKLIALLTGGTVAGGNLFLMGCKSGPKADAGFSAGNIAFLDEVGETIIPATNTPGAKAAKIGEFMKVMVSDCYTQAEQDRFMEGFESINAASETMFKKGFMEITPEQRKEVLVSLEKESKAFSTKREEEEKLNRQAWEIRNSTISWTDQRPYVSTPTHYYTMMKQLTLLGFFTSKTGMTETLRHVPVPGRFDGNVPYTKGEKAWAE